MNQARSHVRYPIHLELRGRRALVAGAGRVATRKIERLLETGVQLTVVAPHASAPVRGWAQQGELTWCERPVSEGDVDRCFLVMAATNDAEVNAALARWAKAAGALVSRVDAPDESDFIVPALVRGAHAEATVSTYGQAPSASRRLGRELQRWLTAAPDRFAGEVAAVRQALAARGLSRDEASTRLRRLNESGLYEACAHGDETRIRALVASALGDPT